MIDAGSTTIVWLLKTSRVASFACKVVAVVTRVRRCVYKEGIRTDSLEVNFAWSDVAIARHLRPAVENHNTSVFY